MTQYPSTGDGDSSPTRIHLHYLDRVSVRLAQETLAAAKTIDYGTAPTGDVYAMVGALTYAVESLLGLLGNADQCGGAL